MTSRYLLFVPAAMLFLALAPLPFGYYVLLRFVVCGFALYMAYLAWSTRRALHWTIVVPAIVSALFNPFIPIYLNRPIWNLIDVIVGAGFLVAAIARSLAERVSRGK